MTGLIQRSYQAANGEEVSASPETMRALLQTLGVEHEDDWQNMTEPVVVAWDGELEHIVLRIGSSEARRRIDYEIELEEGYVVGGTIPASSRRQKREQVIGRARKVELICRLGATLPLGYHQLHVRTANGEASALILSSPKRCYSGDRPREWGVFAPVYALRETKTQMIGDFGDLETLMRWVADNNGDLVATLPISATFAHDPSPYSPASRLYWNELYLRTADRLVVKKATELVDYRVATETKRAQIEPVATEFFAQGADKDKSFRAFLKLYPDARQYAQFRATAEKQNKGWPAWPERLRDGKLRSIDFDVDAMEYHLYAQYAAHQQLTSLSRNAGEAGVRLYLDMPLGVHPDSYDVWRNPQLFVTGASAGAPPDPFFTRGQNWGFPPMHPVRMREDQYRYWRRVLQTQLRYAGMLRLDHVMALHRLYVVPQGAEASEGAYVRYPSEELYAVITLESARHDAVVVGEDLGTVPPEVRKSMGEHGVKRMYVVQFEANLDGENPLSEIPREAVASINTHDMPSFKAYWEGHDAELRHELGLIDKDGVKAATQEREKLTKALTRQLSTQRSTPDALRSTLKHLAQSPADIVLLNLEDIWLEAEPQNVPGTSSERPNWRRRLRYTLKEIKENADVRETIDMVEHARRDGSEG
ncbi:MAG TPA: 4-alpha-glucanotransferase [Longimicrobiales bacterium]|nr:4-alpha-glucanotransferase [Longimicrobiales bacterium]